MGAGAIADACRRANEDGRRPGVDYLGEYRVDWTNSLDEGVEHPTIHSAFSYAAQLVVVDRESGRIEKVVAVHDVGRAVNPMLCEGQIQGSVHMGLGYALSEDFPADTDGRPTHMTLRSLGILRPKDVPPIEPILVEEPQPARPLRHQGDGGDRPRADGRRGGGRPPRLRRELARDAADACRQGSGGRRGRLSASATSSTHCCGRGRRRTARARRGR